MHRGSVGLGLGMIRTSMAVSLLALVTAPGLAAGQSAAEPQPEAPEGPNDILVIGERRSAMKNIQPIATFDENVISGTGASSIAELMKIIGPVAKSADGSDPIVLINGQRVSGFNDIGSLPPEAIEKIEVLPEPAALKYGFPPTRRVMNFITKRHFQQKQVGAAVGTTTRLGSQVFDGTFGFTRLRNDARMTFSLERHRTTELMQSERDILPDPDLLFDSVGNVTGIDGGPIDPTLSAAAGEVVTSVPVPLDPAQRTLAGFAAGANEPRLFDLGPFRTLTPLNDTSKAEATWANRIGKTLGASANFSFERSRDRTISGPAPVVLTVPESNSYSPFSGPVLLHRYLTEADPLRQHQTTTKLHAGTMLRGAIAGWRWDVTTSFDQRDIHGTGDRGISITEINAAIAGGANPFAPFDPALLSNRLVDRARLRTRSMGTKGVITNSPIDLPAGAMTVTLSAEAERATADSSTRGANPFELHIGRTRTEGSVAVDVPIASKSEDVLGFIGDLSINASANARSVGGFGSLFDRTLGTAWTPFKGLQVLLQDKRSASAPALDQLSSPVVSMPNYPVFDFMTGRSEVVTVTQGGNPDLKAEHRHVRSLAFNIKPLAKREIRLTATYEDTTIRDQTGTVFLLRPDIAAILPDISVRDASGRLVSASFQPTNFYLERQKTLSLVLNAFGPIGKAPKPDPKAKPVSEPARVTYYGGMGPSLKLSDRLQLRPGTRAFDLLGGDSVTGGGGSRFSGYFYGGVNYLGNGFNVDGWYQTASRVNGPTPASTLRFAPVFKMNASAFISVHHFLRKQDWTRKLQLKLEVSNLTDSRPKVRDGNGNIPFRLQPDSMEPVGRTVKLSFRKLFQPPKR